MSLQIEENIIEDLENFKWEKWRAVTLNKEKRKDGDFYFGTLVRNYSEKDSLYDYDIGQTRAEYCKIGRIVEFVGNRILDLEPDSPTFNKRVFTKPETEVVTYLDRGEEKKKTVLVVRKGVAQGKKIWGFNIPDTKDNVEKLEGLVGPLDMTKRTNLTIIKGNQYPISADEKSFFTKSVDEMFEAHFAKLDGNKNDSKK